jgi:hypothetical protein
MYPPINDFEPKITSLTFAATLAADHNVDCLGHAVLGVVVIPICNC